MSDRVPIIGGTTGGRDHFPFPVVDYVAPPDYPSNYFPISIPLSSAAKWFYLVSKWSVVVHAEMDVSTDVFEYDGSDLVTNTYTGHATWDATFDLNVFYLPVGGGSSIQVDREAKLVLTNWRTPTFLSPPTGSLLWSDATTTTVIIGEGVVTILDVGFDVSYSAFLFKDGLFYPQVYIELHLVTNCRPANLGPFSGAYSGGSEQLNFNVGTKAYLPSGSSIMPGIGIDSDPVPTFYELVHDPTSEVTTAITLSNPQLEITITPSEFWPYANSNGDPVYNTSDGSIINDPFS